MSLSILLEDSNRIIDVYIKTLSKSDSENDAVIALLQSIKASHRDLALLEAPMEDTVSYKENDWDDWIKHEGGSCPFEDDDIVSIEMNDGEIYDGEEAGNFYWKRSDVLPDRQVKNYRTLL